MADPDKPKRKPKANVAKTDAIVPEIPKAPVQSKTTPLTWLKRYVDFKNLEGFINDERGTGSLKDSLLIVFIAQMVSLLTLFLATIISSILFPVTTQTPGQLVLGLTVIVLIGGIVIFYLTAGSCSRSRNSSEARASSPPRRVSCP